MTEALLFEWISVLLRWAHVLVAIAWIGASFYLISWENKFNRLRNLREGVEGDFWTIQGGDFYLVEKLKSAPRQLPAELHWFRYEAYFTWVSGFILMCVFYYSNASIMLLDQSSPLDGSFQAIAASVLSLLVIWLAYALYCNTRLARNLGLSALVGIFVVALLAWFYGLLFNGRAAFLHIGAAMGTIMSANVFFSIIPWHKRLVSAIASSEPLDEIYRSHPGFRSRHNHYMTLPVLFLMLSGHAPVNFDGSLSWLVAALLVTAMGLLKHFHTCIQRKTPAIRYLLAGLIVLTSAILISSSDARTVFRCEEKLQQEQVEKIIASRCESCHNSNSGTRASVDSQNVPVWSNPNELLALRTQARNLVLINKTMPPANVTGMTEHERGIFACWLENAVDPGLYE
ncbi:MAG: putative membrane protein [Lysobacterales bacterium]|jgi:uncharacterized membrane protein